MSGFVFRAQWRLPVPPAAAFAVLADVEGYPRWWPQIRRAQRIDATSGELTCRSLLPYDIVFVLRREVEDPDAGILRARLSGDLVGTSQWTITTDRGGTLASFDERVTVGNDALRVAGRLLRPVVRFNHELMMRAGEKGLRAQLRAGA